MAKTTRWCSFLATLRGESSRAARLRPLGAACSVVFFLGCASPPRAASSPSEKPARLSVTPLARANVRGLLERGDYALAEKTLGQPGDQESKLLLGEIYLATGRPELVEGLLGASGAKAARFRGRAAFEMGHVEEALAIVDESNAEPEATLFGAELRFFYGQRADAEVVLRRLAIDSAAPLEVRGRAAHLLGQPKEANELYNQAEEAHGLTPSLAQRRVELYLEKYDSAHAGQIIREARQRHPADPDLLALDAQQRFADALDFVHAEELAGAALKINPGHAAARAVLVSVALRDGELTRARSELEIGLRHRPLDLGLLALRAAVRFLEEDDEGLKRELETLVQLSPCNARIYEALADNAEWEHRYGELDALLRRAVRTDRSSGALRGRLGLNLLRYGDESEALVELRESFRLDPYDVRVKNTLELFEQSVKKNYVELRRGVFVFRFPKNESALLERYIPALAEQAREKYEATYGVEIPKIQVELYASKEEFSVRTSGLPNAGIAGVCFGRKLAAVTPRGSLTNVGMTLWHELAHARALAESPLRQSL